MLFQFGYNGHKCTKTKHLVDNNYAAKTGNKMFKVNLRTDILTKMGCSPRTHFYRRIHAEILLSPFSKTVYSR